MNFRPLLALAGIFSLWSGILFAQGTPLPSFTVETVQTSPDQPDRAGSIAKSGSLLRLEFTQDGQRIVQILRPTDGVSYVLFPDSQTYMEQRTPAQPEEFLESYTPPCPSEAEENGLQCRRLGQEVYQSIPVERWYIGANNDPSQMIILWDPTRKRALRQEMSNGTLAQMTFLGMQTIEDRDAEHWVTEVSRPGEATLRNEWWYDNELKLVLRETFPDGTHRQLTNIIVGPVDPTLFTVPDGWQRIYAPNQSPQE